MNRLRLISMRQTEARTSLSGRSITRKVAVKEFPQPIQISERRKAFVESEIDAWIAEQLARARGYVQSVPNFAELAPSGISTPTNNANASSSSAENSSLTQARPTLDRRSKRSTTKAGKRHTAD